MQTIPHAYSVFSYTTFRTWVQEVPKMRSGLGVPPKKLPRYGKGIFLQLDAGRVTVAAAVVRRLPVADYCLLRLPT